MCMTTKYIIIFWNHTYRYEKIPNLELPPPTPGLHKDKIIDANWLISKVRFVPPQNAKAKVYCTHYLSLLTSTEMWSVMVRKHVYFIVACIWYVD